MHRTTTGLHIWRLNIAARRLAARDQWVQASMRSRIGGVTLMDTPDVYLETGGRGDREGIIGAVGVVFSQSRRGGGGGKTVHQ